MLKILVTGGAGFIGSNFIIRCLDSTEYQILNIDKLTYSGNPENLSDIKSNYNFICADICDKHTIRESINNFNPDIIINFAAESHVDRSIDNYSDFINTNILGTINLLDLSLEYWNKNKNSNFKFIHISTDEVYGSLDNEGSFTENSAYFPSSPYSASKASSDHFVNAWHRTFKLPTIITNCSNNYGPFQFPEKLIPLMIINALKEAELPVYGDGKNIRDWIHVYDHCDALIKIIKDGEVGEKYNIGGDCELMNIKIINMICEYIDTIKPRESGESYNQLIKFVEDRPGHDYRYSVNFNKISDTLGWSPKIRFEDGIKETIEWYIQKENWWKKITDKKYNLERLGQVK